APPATAGAPGPPGPAGPPPGPPRPGPAPGPAAPPLGPPGPPGPPTPPKLTRPKSPLQTAAFQDGLSSQALSSFAIPLSITMYESRTPPTEPSMSWNAAPFQPANVPNSPEKDQRRSSGGKYTGLAFSNVS